LLKKGEGWRIGWQDEEKTYQGLIGASSWAMELTAAEMTDFCRLLLQITETMTAMAEHLMDEETIFCEVESPLMWLGAQGYIDNYSVRIILTQNRGCEGSWPGDTIPELVQAVQSFNLF